MNVEPGHPSGASVQEWLRVVLDDFRATPVADVEVALIDFDPARSADLVAVLPDAASWMVPDEPSLHRLLLRVGQNVTALDELVSSPSATAVEIASHLQDFVMDALNRPWPEVNGQHGAAAVLEPRLRTDDTPQWAGGGVVCAFGELRTLL